jgi:hypothetical protein
MLLPEGVIKYKPVKIEFVNLEKFLDSLSQDLFTGYCEFRTKEKSIVLLFEEGETQRTFCLEKTMTTLFSLSEALEECKSPTGEVRGVVLPSEMVDMMVRLLFCVPLHQNLSSAFTDFKTLLKTLGGEEFTGFVEIGMEENVHYLSLKNGGPRSALYFSGERLFQGAEALERIFHDEEMERAFINIYPFREIPLKTVFTQLSGELLRVYQDLKGPILTQQFWKKLSSYAEEIDGVRVGNLEFSLEDLPIDLRKQEKTLVSLLRCHIDILASELGDDAVQSLYTRLLEEIESPVREVFGGVLQ